MGKLPTFPHTIGNVRFYPRKSSILGRLKPSKLRKKAEFGRIGGWWGEIVDSVHNYGTKMS